MSEVTARQLAIDTRLKLGLQSTEHFDVDRATRSLGITVFKRPLESSVSGATLKTDRVKLVLVNTNKSLGHQHFTIAHELYHCLHDEHLVSTACKVESFEHNSETEKMAEWFAVHLLLPEDAIFNQLRLRSQLGTALNIADVVHLEQFFGVSRRAMCWRLQDLQLMTREQADRWCVNVVQSARALGRDTVLYKPTYERALLSDYAEKAAEALERDLITEARYEELLADADLLEEVIGSEEEVDNVD